MLLVLALTQVLALEGATVHTMVPGAEPVVATVVVEEGRFTAIGPNPELPEDAVRVDLTGKHLFPGLIDGMVHHDLEHDALYVLSGVTLVRDMGNDLGRVFIAAAPNVRNSVPGPEMMVAGAIFDGVPPATTEAVIVRNAAEVLDKLPRLIEAGAQLASFHLGIPEEAWVQLLTSSAEIGLQTWGPVPSGKSLADVIYSGQTGIIYLEGFTAPEGTEAVGFAHEQALSYAEQGVASMPLLNVYCYRTEDQGDDPPAFNLLAPYYVDWWRADLAQRRAVFTEEYLAQGRAEYKRRQALVLDLWKSGVTLVPGSAAPNPWMIPGAGLHDELAAWEAAGIPRDAILDLATRGCAEALGIGEERGTIEVGKVADALVLAGDPGQDLAILRSPEGVLVRGGFLNQEYLDALRQAMREAQLELRANANKPLVVEKPELPEGRIVLEGRVVSHVFEREAAAEEYWVVRTYEGDTAWCSRMVTPEGLTTAGTEQTLIQRYDEGKLQSFNFDVQAGDMHYVVEGLIVSGKLRIKRWMNGEYVDTNSNNARPQAVEAGMALSAMILSHYNPDGPVQVVYFDGMDPVLGSWELMRSESGMLSIRTSEGPMVATFNENGGVDKVARVQGKTTVRYESERCDSFGGPGMPGLPYVAPAAGEGAAGKQPAGGDGEVEGGGDGTGDKR